MKQYYAIQPNKLNFTHLRVEVAHKKSQKGVFLCVAPVCFEGDLERQMLIGDFSERSQKLRDLPRFNQNALEQTKAAAQRELEQKAGKSWEFVNNVLNQTGLNLQSA
jgi:hypothetical protein